MIDNTINKGKTAKEIIRVWRDDMKNLRASKNIKGGLCMKKKLSIIIVVLLLLGCAYYFGVGFLPATNVVVTDFEVSEQQDSMTIQTSIATSAGYTRSVKNVSDDPEKMMLKFYSAFGGVNGSIGAKSEFDLPLSPECKEIYVLLYDDYKLLIAKNPATGEWEMV